MGRGTSSLVGVTGRAAGVEGVLAVGVGGSDGTSGEGSEGDEEVELHFDGLGGLVWFV